MNFATSTRIFSIDTINQIKWVVDNKHQLKAGDIVKVKIIEKNDGILNRLELSNNSVIELDNGHEFIGVIGSRSAVDYLSGRPPTGLSPYSNTYTLSIGGVIGEITNFTKNVYPPPSVQIINFATIGGKFLNTIDYYEKYIKQQDLKPRNNTKAIVVIGDGRSSGKTTTAGKCIAALKKLNIKLGGAKLTGIARKRDILKFSKQGCDIVTDFIDCGLPSTVIEQEVYEKIISYYIEERFSDEYLWVCELGGGFLSDYNVETAIRLLSRKVNVVAYIICSKTRIATYGSYILMSNILKELGKENTKIFISGAITNSSAGVMSIRKYAPSASILKVFESNDTFAAAIQSIL